MIDNYNIGGDDYGFDNIDSSDNASDGDDSDSGGAGGSREYNNGGYEFDRSSGRSGDDFGVFNFWEGDDEPHATIPVPPAGDKPRNASPIQTFSIVEGLQQIYMEILWLWPTLLLTRLNLLTVSDSLDFGDAGKGGNIHQECNPCNVEPPKQMNVFSRITSPNVPLDMLTAPPSTNLS